MFVNTDDEINSDNSLAWDDSSNFTALPGEKSVRNEHGEKKLSELLIIGKNPQKLELIGND